MIILMDSIIILFGVQEGLLMLLQIEMSGQLMRQEMKN
jgi:hypothetical protein